MPRHTSRALLLLVLAASLVRAETPEGRTEISILGGASLLDIGRNDALQIPVATPPVPEPWPSPPYGFEERTRMGGSALLGFRLGRYLSDRAEVGVAFTLAPSHHVRTESRGVCIPEIPCPLGGARPDFVVSSRETVAAYEYAATFTYDVLGGEMRPFLTFGLGAASFAGPEQTRTDFALQLGAGAKMYFGKRMGFRMELVDEVVPDHYLTGRAEHDLHVQGGLVFRP